MNFTAQQIADEQQAVFDDLYTVADIMKGNTIEMHQEARRIALLNLKDRAEGNYFDIDEAEAWTERELAKKDEG